MRLKTAQSRLVTGFSLIELLVVIAIISILISLAVPQYNQYVARAKFLEVILAASPYKVAAEVAVYAQGASQNDLNAGNHSIPNAVAASDAQYIDSIDMQQGVIRIVSKNILADGQPQPTYNLAIEIVNGSVSWSIEASSSCLTYSLCD